ncbi:MAG: hypothetical protein JOZ56_05130 [Actinobacteria bacterium]|nr:hypothetical protein [Actinomycetota bacterium]MBV8562454.1 hypothetical protein [Actinomycetota bacterium]
MTRRLLSRRLAGLATLTVAAVAGIGAYASTASNAVPTHYSGIGENQVSGYSVVGYPAYTWNADGTLYNVEVVLDHNANDLKIALVNHSATPVPGDWSAATCTKHGGGSPPTTDWDCNYGSPGLAQITVGTVQNSDLYIAAVEHGSVTIH